MSIVAIQSMLAVRIELRPWFRFVLAHKPTLLAVYPFLRFGIIPACWISKVVKV